jgi:predicted double-glycine peptidase
VRSLLEMRRARVVAQDFDLSCGAAALATLLTHQLGDPVSEREVTLGLLGGRREYLDDPGLLRVRQGFSLLDLKRYVERRGHRGVGLGNLTLADLVARAPVMVPVDLTGYDHFVVFRGLAGGRVFLADPAWGNRAMPVERFEAAWIDYPGFGRVGFVVARADGGDGGPPPNRLAPRPGEDFTVPGAVLREAVATAAAPRRREGRPDRPGAARQGRRPASPGAAASPSPSSSPRLARPGPARAQAVPDPVGRPRRGAAGDGPAPWACASEELERRLARPRALILSRRPGPRPGADARGSRTDSATPAGPQAAPARRARPPASFVVDEEAAERALEQALVQTGALLLEPGTAELRPSLGYVRIEGDEPGLVFDDGRASSRPRRPGATRSRPG